MRGSEEWSFCNCEELSSKKRDVYNGNVKEMKDRMKVKEGVENVRCLLLEGVIFGSSFSGFIRSTESIHEKLGSGMVCNHFVMKKLRKS